jgi:histidinol-phosphate phosphatase family protein
VTNQSGIARGKLDEPKLAEIHDRLGQLLDQQGATLDAIYYCPYLDGEEATVEAYRQDSDLRKPKPGMLIKASMERKLDLPASWSIGNSLRDAQAGRAAGCRTILVPRDPSEGNSFRKNKAVDFLASSLDEAVDIVLKHSRPAENSSSPAESPHRTTALLQEILAFLRTVDRRNRAEDFSFAKLAGAVIQIVAIAALLWGLFAMIRGAPQVTIRLLLAMVLQMMALTFFLLSQKR